MFLREIFVNPRRTAVLKEGGGNIWPETVAFYPSPEMVQALLSQVKTYLSKAGFPLYVQGSGANSDPSPEHPTGDLDVSCDMDQVKQFFKIPQSKKLADDDKAARNALEQFLLDNGVPATYKAGVTVHIKFPYNKQFYQCDIKVVRKAEKVSKFHQHQIPRGSPYKGVHKQVIMSALASAKNMLWSPDEGLYARDANRKKADLISDDWDEIARTLLGPGHTGKNLGSSESIMAAIKDPTLKKQVHDAAVTGASWTSTPLRGPATPLLEAATVGRKYQHIEDLVFTNGSKGGMHAVERLSYMGTKGMNIELKWDGSPVIYWGRDEQGAFHMFPKNAWDYLKRGTTETKSGVSTMMNDADDVAQFILGTGTVQPGQEQGRQAFAQGLAELWPLFESISPKSGYIEGGILFSPTEPPEYNPTSGDFDFTPNITSFHIPANSDLGKRIGKFDKAGNFLGFKAQLMVAATGFYAHIGAVETRYDNAEKLSTPDVIVQGTTYVENAPKMNDSGLKHAENYIKANKANIDSFIAGQPGLSKPGDVLYTFFNQNLRVAGVKQKFVQWANDKLSAAQAQKILSHPGLDAVLTAVEMLTNEKMKLISGLSSGTHGGIRQTKPEGYVQAHPGGKFKNDLPGQFVKTIDQANWAPRKD
jgi:hypothetical protein